MKVVVVVVLLVLLSPAIYAQAPLTITTEPNAIVWIDEIRRGTTDASGKLTVNRVSAGRHVVRVRAKGFKEATTPLPPGRRALTVKLLPTTDQAELLFQEAEDAREKARGEEALKKAADIYREAIKLRPAFPAAHVGLARVLMDLNDFKEAHAAIEAARRTRPSYAEASAVEGRIYREEAFDDEALRSFRRALREAERISARGPCRNGEGLRRQRAICASRSRVSCGYRTTFRQRARHLSNARRGV